MLKILKSGVPIAELRSMLNKPEPGPWTVSDLLMTSSELVKVIVPVIAKVTVSPLEELEITCRSEPAPLSAVDVTIFVAAMPENEIRPKTNSRQKTLFRIIKKKRTGRKAETAFPYQPYKRFARFFGMIKYGGKKNRSADFKF